MIRSILLGMAQGIGIMFATALVLAFSIYIGAMIGQDPGTQVIITIFTMTVIVGGVSGFLSWYDKSKT